MEQQRGTSPSMDGHQQEHAPLTSTTTTGPLSSSTRSVSPASTSAISSCGASRVAPPRTLHQATLSHAAVASNPDSSVISFDNTKAGLQNVDKAKTEALIKELSEGSPFYANEQRKAAARERKIQEMLHKAKLFEQNIVLPHQAATAAAGLTAKTKYAELAGAVEKMERELLLYGDEFGLRQEKVYAHMDMDMFYAAVEEKKDPSLKLKPLGVGSNSMLSTTNYIARQYGVRSGMPGFIGKKLCPDLVIKPCDFSSYKREAQVVRAIVAQYDPAYTSAGWDELTMELSEYLEAKERDEGHHRCHDGEDDNGEEEQQRPLDSGTTPTTGHEARMRRKYAAAERVVAEIRAKVTEMTGLTASAGIAPTSTLAKMASNYNKPNGQHTLWLYTRQDIMAFMHGLPCRKVPGIGKSQEHILNGLGIHTIGDIYAHRVLLYHLITPKTFHFLLSTSLGVGGMFHDEREDTAAGESKPHRRANEDVAGEEYITGTAYTRQSIGQERTFYKLKNALELETIARQNLLDAWRGMQDEHLLARQMVLKLKHVSFQVKQYSKSITPPSDDVEVLQRTLNALMTPLANCFADYRLLGVRLCGLISKEQYEQELHAHDGRPQQPTLMDFLGRQALNKVEGTGRKRGRSSSSHSSSCFSISSGSSDGDEPGCDDVTAESDDVVVVPDEESADGGGSNGRDAAVIGKNASSASVEIVSPTTIPAHEAAEDVIFIE